MQEEELYPRGEKTLGVFNKKELVELSQQNSFLKRGGYMFEEDPFAEDDYQFNFMSYPDREVLKRFFSFGNWAIRTGAIHQNLCFIQSDNGGDEWWTVKKFEDGELIPFECISWRHIIKQNEEFKLMSKAELQKYIDSWGRDDVQEILNDPYNHDLDRLLKATKEQCRKGEW